MDSLSIQHLLHIYGCAIICGYDNEYDLKIWNRIWAFHGIDLPSSLPWLGIGMHLIDDRYRGLPLPLLFSLAVMDRFKMYYDETIEFHIRFPVGVAQQSNWRLRHAFYIWNPQLFRRYIQPQLSNIHRRFGNPAHVKLYELLIKRLEEVVDDAMVLLLRIDDGCRTCQLHQQSPRRFQFTIPGEARFNQFIYTDVSSIQTGKCLHILDSTRSDKATERLNNCKLLL